MFISYTEVMRNLKNCNCGDNVIPAPQPLDKSCALKPARVTFRTKLIPASLGDDTGAYKPEPGSAYDTLVIYQENGAIYFYDSNGVFTCIHEGWANADHELLHSFAAKIDELYDPIVAVEEVESYEDLQGINPSTIPSDGYVSVRHDENHDYREALYFYDAATKSWVFYDYASPYYTKDVLDTLLEEIERQIREEAEAREAKDAELEQAITTEIQEREQADQEINDRITDIQNSPDVRFIVDTYADLEELDKAEVGDKDYARVLQDETHDGASTYYQFNLADQTWTYIGMTGPYYTKQEIDEKIDNIPTAVLYNEYGENEDGALTQKFVSDKLNGQSVVIGVNAVDSRGTSVVIGHDAQASSASNEQVIIGGRAKGSVSGIVVAVGPEAQATGTGSIAIGGSTKATETGATAIGGSATNTYATAIRGTASNRYSTALGYKATTTRDYELSLGNSTDITCYIANVTAGEKDTDAVNVKQMRDYVTEQLGDIEALLKQLDTGEGVVLEEMSSLDSGNGVNLDEEA